jgi:hypothetical protein
MRIYDKLRQNVARLAEKLATTDANKADVQLALAIALDLAVNRNVAGKARLHAEHVRRIAAEFSRRRRDGDAAVEAFARHQVGKHRPSLGAARSASLVLLAESIGRHRIGGSNPAVSDHKHSVADLAAAYGPLAGAMLDNPVALAVAVASLPTHASLAGGAPTPSADGEAKP